MLSMDDYLTSFYNLKIICVKGESYYKNCKSCPSNLMLLEDLNFPVNFVKKGN